MIFVCMILGIVYKTSRTYQRLLLGSAHSFQVSCMISMNYYVFCIFFISVLVPPSGVPFGRFPCLAFVVLNCFTHYARLLSWRLGRDEKELIRNRCAVNCRHVAASSTNILSFGLFVTWAAQQDNEIVRTSQIILIQPLAEGVFLSEQ